MNGTLWLEDNILFKKTNKQKTEPSQVWRLL